MSNHIDIQDDLLPLLGRKEDVLDGITGFVEHYDFSRANSSYEARVQAITMVASICYQSPKALGSVSLFNRLQAESAGLPSSSYEFIPVLVPAMTMVMIGIDMPNDQVCNTLKYGEELEVDGEDYVLSNLRALIEDVGEEESLNYLNTSEEEIQIIRDNFKVFLYNVDLSTRAQMVRHRVSWQELSRRYVSGKKKEFEFYISKKMEEVYSTYDEGPEHYHHSITKMIEGSINAYNKAISFGVKPEEARRILPQAMMTQIWGAYQPKQLEGFFKLRLDKHAQLEIRHVAEAMKELA